MAHVYHRGDDSHEMITIADGTAGIMQTARIMRALVGQYKSDLEIRDLAMGLVEHLPAKDELAEIDALFTFVRDSIRYVKDIYGIETISTPPVILRTRQGDCDDKSVLLATLLESIGYATAFKITGYSQSREFEHVYVVARTHTGLAVNLDATEPEAMGWEAPNPTISAYVQ